MEMSTALVLPVVPPINRPFARAFDPRYGSRSEAACAAMLERYVSGWKPVIDETIQVQIGTKRIDFRVNGVFVEYHPISLEREFACSSSWREIKRTMLRLRPFDRRELARSLEAELYAQYYKRRRLLIDSSPYKDSELTVVCNFGDFYRGVLKRFSSPELPRERTVLAEWEQAKEALKVAART